MGSKLSAKLNLLHSKYPFLVNTWFPDYLLGFLPQADRLLPELPSECGEKSACGWKRHEGHALGPDEGPGSPSLTKLSQDKNYIHWRRHMDSNKLDRDKSKSESDKGGSEWKWSVLIQLQQGETGTRRPIGQIAINGWSFLGVAAPKFLLSPLPVSSPSQQPAYASPGAASWLYLANTGGTREATEEGARWNVKRPRI